MATAHTSSFASSKSSPAAVKRFHGRLKGRQTGATGKPAKGLTSWKVRTDWKGGTRNDTHVTEYSIGGERVEKDFTIKIELVLASGSGKLGGKREQDTKDGIATFADLKVDEPGDGKVLRALAPEGAFLGFVESQPFRVEED